MTNTINWGTLANTVYTASLVDYILFLTADVDVTPNLNEIRDFKYVSKEELQAMFEDKGKVFLLWDTDSPVDTTNQQQIIPLLLGSNLLLAISFLDGGIY